MIQVFFFGPDYVALIPEDGERVVLTIDEAMTLVPCVGSGEFISAFRTGPLGQSEQNVYQWSTPNLVQTIIGDHRRQIYNSFTINKNRTA
jgi:hypothetical protein